MKKKIFFFSIELEREKVSLPLHPLSGTTWLNRGWKAGKTGGSGRLAATIAPNGGRKFFEQMRIIDSKPPL